MSNPMEEVNKRRVFLFSVGINNYKSEQVDPLKGCKNDVLALQSYLKLKLQLPEKQCLALFDDKASRAEIIKHFRSHFADLRDGDIAVFHFSGHGAWEWSADEFVKAKIDLPGGKNEMILPYDFACDNVRGIADKEFRLLIAEMQHKSSKKPKNIHFVGLMDCCFSGSMFRNEEASYEDTASGESVLLQSRRFSKNDPSARPLGEFLEGQYLKTYQETQTITLPEIDYLLISASSPREPAMEDEEGGLFTQALLRVLSSGNYETQFPSYETMHFLISSSIHFKTKHNQHPSIEYNGNVKPYQSFLLNGGNHQPMLSEMNLLGGFGLINIGAIHGITWSKWQNTAIDIFQTGEKLQKVGHALLEELLVESSKVTFFPNEHFQKGGSQKLLAAIHGDPLLFNIKVEEGAIRSKEQLLSRIKEKGMAKLLKEHHEAVYSIDISQSQIFISRDDELIIGVEQANHEVAIEFTIQMLSMIAKFEQIKKLHPPKKSFIDLEKIDFEFSYTDYNNQEHTFKVWPSNSDVDGVREVSIPFNLGKGNKGYIFYKVSAGHNQSRRYNKLYFYMLTIDRKLNISQLFESNKLVRQLQNDMNFRHTFDSTGEVALAITDPNINQVEDLYYLIISVDPLESPYLLEQKGLGKYYGEVLPINTAREFIYRGNIKIEKGGGTTARWSVKKLKVKLIRENS